MLGEGRHYLDVYTRPGVELGPTAHGTDESRVTDPLGDAAIARVNECEFGFEVANIKQIASPVL